MFSKQLLFWVSVEEKKCVDYILSLFFFSIFPETLYIW